MFFLSHYQLCFTGCERYNRSFVLKCSCFSRVRFHIHLFPPHLQGLAEFLAHCQSQERFAERISLHTLTFLHIDSAAASPASNHPFSIDFCWLFLTHAGSKLWGFLLSFSFNPFLLVYVGLLQKSETVHLKAGDRSPNDKEVVVAIVKPELEVLFSSFCILGV